MATQPEPPYHCCLRCGSQLTHPKDNLYVCTTCDFHFYDNPKPCNAAIITNDVGDVMVCKRRVEPKKDYWDVCGGFVDLHENFEQSMVREIKEELDVGVIEMTYFRSYHDRYEFKGDNYHTLCVVYIVKTDSEDYQPQDDISEVAFFSKENFPYDQMAFPMLSEAIKDYFNSVSQMK